jgi:hypothetical protein
MSREVDHTWPIVPTHSQYHFAGGWSSLRSDLDKWCLSIILEDERTSADDISLGVAHLSLCCAARNKKQILLRVGTKETEVHV